MKIRFFSPKYLLTLAALCPLLVSAVEPRTWNSAYAKESPLDVEVSTLIEEITTPSVRPSFGSLKKIYSNAYTSVPAIRKTTAELDGLRMGVAEKEGKNYPRLTLQTNGGQSSVDSLASKANDQARTTTLAADQLLYDFGATSSEIAAAKTRLAAGIDKAEAERLRVLFSMVTVQLELQAAKKLIVFYGSNEKSRQQFFDLIQEKLNLGASSALDLARANTKLLEAKAKIPAMAGEIFRAESAVQELFGVVPEFTFAFYQLPDVSVNFGGNIDLVVSRHPLVLQASKNLEVAIKELDYLKSTAFGRIALKSSVSNSKQPITGNVNTASVFIEYSNTLFDGFSNLARIGAAREKVAEFEIEQERTVRMVRQQLLTALTEYQSAKETLEVRGKLLISARKSARDLYTAFLLNRGSLTDIFDAEESYFTAAESTLNALTSVQRAYYKLLHLSGELSNAFELKL
jgi:adhesin transport system outer membrane protein